MRGKLGLLVLLSLIIIGAPIGLLHAGSSYAPILFDDDTQGVSDSITVVVAHQGNLTDTLIQTDAQVRQAKLARNNTEAQFGSDQLTKDTSKPLAEPLTLIESLSQSFQSNNLLWLWAVLTILVGAVIAGIVGAVVAFSRRKPVPFKNVPRARTT